MDTAKSKTPFDFNSLFVESVFKNLCGFRGLPHRLTAEAYFKEGDRLRAVSDIEKAIGIVQKLRDANALNDSDANLVEELEKEKSAYRVL